MMPLRYSLFAGMVGLLVLPFGCGPRPDADETERPNSTAVEGTATPTLENPTYPPTNEEGPLTITPGGLSFLDAPVGCLTEKVLSVENVGDELVNITQLLLSSGLGSQFSIEGGPVALTPGDKAEFTLGYFPLEVEELEGSFVIISSAEPESIEVPVDSSAVLPEVRIENFHQDLQSVDLLLLLDVSGSMADLTQNFGHVLSESLQQLLSDGVSYHVGILTSAVTDEGEFVGNFGDQKMSFVTSEMGASGISELEAEIAKVYTMGTFGDERTFDNLARSLSPDLLTGHNLGFFRNETALAMIALTDEDDHSLTSPEQLSDLIISVVPSPFVSGEFMLGLAEYDSFRISPNSCSSERGKKWIELAGILETGFSDLCLQTYQDGIDRVLDSADITPLQHRFELSEFAMSGSGIQVTITEEGGASMVTTGWSYESATHTIVFEADAIPTLGTTILVEYQPISSCD